MKRGKWFLVAAFFGAFGWLLYSRGRDLDWHEVWVSVTSFDAITLAAGLAFTLLAYLCFGGYDLLARRHLRHAAPVARVQTIAMVAYALNLNLGALVGGWASRFRLYSRVGLTPGTITQIIGLGIVSNWTGYVLIAGGIFLIAPPDLPDTWPLSAWVLRMIGGGLLLLAAAYLGFCALRHGRRLRLRGLELRVPSLGFAGLQMLASTVHWLAAGMVMSGFMPAELAFSTVLGVLLMSSIVGAAIHVPGGLGVIEAVFVAVFSDRFPAAHLLGSVLAYRACYYLGPLLVSLAAYPFLEIRGPQPAARAHLVRE